MADILFNKSGVPLIAYGKSYQATTTGTPAEKPKNHPLIQPGCRKESPGYGQKECNDSLMR